MRESGEMYLETILVLTKNKENVRAKDIVERMGFSKPSVSRAMGNLKKDGDIVVDTKGFITLTEKGASIAKKIYERHEVLSNLLIGLGVDPAVAAEDACKIEHDISDTTFEAIKQHIHEKSKQ
ncbi:MAG: metal-dependent transcriptional regulator [Clostridia bacterium]|nr:metal-dependent transcriptional regulator [Clostridia bacterium]